MSTLVDFDSFFLDFDSFWTKFGADLCPGLTTCDKKRRGLNTPPSGSRPGMEKPHGSARSSLTNSTGGAHKTDVCSCNRRDSAVEAGQMSAVRAGQMSVVEATQMSSADTRQMSTGKTGRCPDVK